MTNIYSRSKRSIIIVMLSLSIISCQNSFMTEVIVKKERGKAVHHESVAPKTPINDDSQPGLIAIAKSHSNYIALREYDTQLSPSLLLNQDKSQTQIASFIEDYLNQHSSNLKISWDELTLRQDPIRLKKNLHVYTLSRHLDGVPVRDRYVDFYFSMENGKARLQKVVNLSGGLISLQNSDVDNSFEAKDLLPLGTDLVDSTPIIFSNDDGYFDATALTIREGSTTYEAIVERGTGLILEASSDTTHFEEDEESIFIQAQMWLVSIFDEVKITPSIPQAMLTAGGQQSETTLDGVAETIDGDFTLTLSSDRFVVTEDSSAGPVEVQGTVVDGKATLNEDNLQSRGLSLYTSLHRMNSYARRFVSPSETNFLDSQVDVRYNVANNMTCNAFFQAGVGLQFLPCPEGINFEESNQVVYHEWGHAYDFAVGRNPGITEQAFSEGIGDIIGALVIGSANVVNPFSTSLAFLDTRSLDNNAQAPAPQGENIYVEMLIINGAIWDMREGMVARYGEISGAYKTGMLFFRHVLMADSYNESYDLMLTLDDDDNNPATRSPNHCLINQAFAAHNLTAEEADCTDDPFVPAAPIDDSINVNINANGEMLVAIDKDTATKIVACSGEIDECLDEASWDYEFGSPNPQEDKDIFELDGAISKSEFDILTVLNVSEDGEILGSRMLKFITK